MKSEDDNDKDYKPVNEAIYSLQGHIRSNMITDKIEVT